MKIWGAGISGLAAAWHLEKQGKHPVVYEAKKRIGGWIETEIDEETAIELGPRTFSTYRSPLLLALIQEMGLEVVYSKPKTRYIYFQGKLRSAKKMALGCSYEWFKEPFVKGEVGEETIDQFARRKFGKKIAERLVDPIVRGIYGGDSTELSFDACFPGIDKRRSLFAQMGKGGGLFTIRGGMQRLVDALGRRVEVRLGEALSTRGEGISALPPWEIGAVLNDPTLQKWPVAKMKVVAVMYERAKFPEGYGYLVPKGERSAVMGAIFDSEIFGGRPRATVMLKEGGAEEAIGALHDQAGIQGRVVRVIERETRLPLYTIGHKERVRTIQERYPEIRFIGNYLIGPSVENCLKKSFEL